MLEKTGSGMLSFAAHDAELCFRGVASLESLSPSEQLHWFMAEVGVLGEAPVDDDEDEDSSEETDDSESEMNMFALCMCERRLLAEAAEAAQDTTCKPMLRNEDTNNGIDSRNIIMMFNDNTYSWLAMPMGSRLFGFSTVLRF